MSGATAEDSGQPVPPARLSTGFCTSTEGRCVWADMNVDGSKYSALIELDSAEHHRRSDLGLGALTSTGLLHALWELPLGIPWPSDMLQPRDLESLGEARVGWVKLEADRVERYYRPPGRVIVVAAADRSLSRAIRRVIAHPPTSQRIGLWTSGTTRPHPNAAGSLDLAREHGIGVIAANEGSEHVIVAPKAAVVGRPSIYRWWQAELAYRNWLMQTSPTAPAAPSA